MALAIRLELILAVEVDSQRRQAQQGAGVDQVAATILRDDLASHGELSVEPAVKKHAAIDFHSHLLPTGRIEVWGRFESQPGRIRMGADNPEAGVWARALGDKPGHDRTTPDHDVAARFG